MKSPDILLPGKLDEINKYLLDRTGCFAFLVSDVMWQYSEPKTGKGAVELWSIALYAIYHDYGCQYLNFILDLSNKPDDSMDKMLEKSRKHIKRIQSVLRSIIAHGTLDKHSSEELKRIYLPDEEKTLDLVTDEQWEKVAERISNESNYLIRTIYKWADGYKSAEVDIRSSFGASEKFKKSIDSRVLFDTLDNDCRGIGEQRAKVILEKLSKEMPDKKITEWRDKISKLFLCNELCTPQDIIAKLKTFLYEVHRPTPSSSATIGELCGFDFSKIKS